MIHRTRPWALTAVICLASLNLLHCAPEQASLSQPLVTDVPHTAVQDQSIGNCWVYATAAWAESLHLRATGNSVNLSESYWTWHHFHEQLTGTTAPTKLQDGGHWVAAADIIADHGMMRQADFIAAEAEAERSEAQEQAMAQINELLAEQQPEGPLTDESATEVLDLAFGSDMASTGDQVISAKDFRIGGTEDEPLMLQAAIKDPSYKWRYLPLPTTADVNANELEQAQQETFARVFRALNQKLPVILVFMVDFRAFDQDDGWFRGQTLAENQDEDYNGGAHMAVIEDYTVTGAPGFGDLGEGDLSAEEKAAAIKGKLSSLIVKNSWGSFITKGYHRLDRDYLLQEQTWPGPDGSPETKPATLGFWLPPQAP